ncbi:hypothetical protein PSE10B_56040 [Pseudomonas amygdali pv. eriobotryae]|uniref:plasmid partition protein ParG n=1 Tax=Pseudomonas amygdali TaxID=47877 RepID=UPI00167B9A33|nr:plasmid partition protein ParG [Pseudomonas amygdali]GFZ69082.1 hypothetical protein PSE10B_56040 [Pseudomonas amygdali pv. eriobotryae]
MSKLAEKKPLMTLGKPKANAAEIAAKNDGAKAPSKELKRLNVNIDAELHRRFKKAVVSQDTDMTGVLTDLLEGWLKENE